MTISHAIILGIVQGLTEFLPISSSAHLRAFTWICNWSDISESFDLALHIGTLIALCVFFFKDGLFLIKSGISTAVLKFANNSKLTISNEAKQAGKIFWYIVAATIPAGVLSLVLDKVSETIVGDSVNIEIICIAVSSIVMGLLLYFVDKKCKVEKSYDNLSFKDTILIGISQALAAAFPGVSRSGVTITTSRLLNYDRPSSAKTSFFLSIPIVLAAVIVKAKDFDLTYPIPFFLGIFVSFLVGLVVIKVLMEILKKHDYKVFAIYRVVFGLLLLIALGIK